MAPRRLAAVAMAAAILGAGCRGTVPIGHLLDHPYHYDGRKVKVEGRVVGGVGALGYGAYEVDDGTGALVVVAEPEQRGIPRPGARVSVTGWFRSLFAVGPVSGSVILERDRDPRRRH